ncbi:Uncharacterised protein [Mycobacteroides abscessus]|nr:Uncharacterised protein [Mycobacteroides abscessus]
MYHPAGADSWRTRNRAPAFAPPGPVAGTTNEQSPSASEVHSAQGWSTGSGVAPSVYSPSTTPGSGATSRVPTRSPPTRTVTTASPSPGSGTSATAEVPVARAARPTRTSAAAPAATDLPTCANDRRRCTCPPQPLR